MKQPNNQYYNNLSYWFRSPSDELTDISINLEHILEDEYGATGIGLNRKASSVKDQLSSQCLKNIRYIARIRNIAAHEDRMIAKRHIQKIRKVNKEVLKELIPGKFNWMLFAIFIIVGDLVLTIIMLLI